MKRIALTGGNGFLASRFRKLYGQTYEILPICRSAGCPGCVESDYSVAQLTELFSGCDAVLHLAYQKAAAANERCGLRAYAPSMEMTENVLQAAAASGVKNVVFTSSRCVYGDHTDTAFREDDPLHPINYYGVSKAAMEQLCEYYSRKNGLHVKVLRLGQIIGDAANAGSLVNTFLDRCRRDEPLKLIGRSERDYIYVDDVCLALCAAIEHDSCQGIYNIGMGRGLSNREIAATLIDLLQSHSTVAAENGAESRIVLDCEKAQRELDFTCWYDSFEKIAAMLVAAEQNGR